MDKRKAKSRNQGQSRNKDKNRNMDIGRHLAATCMGLSLMGLSLQAQALVTAQAQITEVQWTIVDLTPDDGMAASLDFTGLNSFLQAVGAEPWTNQLGGAPVGSGTGGSVSTANFSATVQIAAGMPSVAGSGAAAFVSASAQGWDAITHALGAVFDGEVTLGPNTGLVLSGRTAMGAQVGLPGERASGTAGVLIFRPDHPSDWSESTASFEAYFDHGDAFPLPFTQTRFDNDGSTPMIVRITAYAMVDTVSVGVVPEPSSWALLLAGAAGLASWQRMRMRSGAAALKGPAAGV